MRPPTADEIALAATMTGDPIAIAAATAHNRPASPHKKPTGRPRKDGQPPHRTAAALEKERQAAAAKVYAATNIKPQPRRPGETAPTKYMPADIEERLRHFCEKCQNEHARIFLTAYANGGHRSAMQQAGIGPLALQGMKNNEDFRQLYDAIRAAHDAATIARTCDTLAELANGDYTPKPDRLPPDMRAASLLMPALDPRFKATAQGTANQVQINISI